MSRRTSITLILFAGALMLIGYSLPWLQGPGVSLSPNAYDLAEWSSLHPAARAESPALLTALLLRLPLACIALMLAFSAPPDTQGRLIFGLGALLLAAALLPPLEFVRAPDDLNYRQQFMLAVVALIGSLVGLSGVLRRWGRVIAVLALVTGAAASAVGLARGYALFTELQIEVTIGTGGVLLTLLFVLTALVLLAAGCGQQTRQPSA